MWRVPNDGDNPALVDLAGLEQLESVGTLYIDSNPALVGLRSVAGIGVSQNPALTNLEGLRNVVELLSPSPLVFFSVNAQLGSLAGIEGIVASDSRSSPTRRSWNCPPSPGSTGSRASSSPATPG